ncbi:MAG: 5-formyltetrahydrofolate cyclo-ligase [Cocleimonas sp.]
MNNLNINKDSIRKKLRQKREQLTTQEQQQKSQLIANNVKKSDLYQQASKIAFYHAVRGEADPATLMSMGTEKHFYLPILSCDSSEGLVFAPIDAETQYKNNVFGIPEPIVKPNNYINTALLDLVVMPLLGFDSDGNRLGMGGGYYDRCFAFKNANITKSPTKPVLIGFAYNFQEIDALHPESWDIGLDIIATENQLIIL